MSGIGLDKKVTVRASATVSHIHMASGQLKSVNTFQVRHNYIALITIDLMIFYNVRICIIVLSLIIPNYNII